MAYPQHPWLVHWTSTAPQSPPSTTKKTLRGDLCLPHTHTYLRLRPHAASGPWWVGLACMRPWVHPQHHIKQVWWCACHPGTQRVECGTALLSEPNYTVLMSSAVASYRLFPHRRRARTGHGTLTCQCMQLCPDCMWPRDLGIDTAGKDQEKDSICTAIAKPSSVASLGSPTLLP